MDSAIPAAIENLLADLTALFPTGGDVEVVDGQLTDYVKGSRVEVLGVHDWHQEPAGLGNMRRDEEFTIRCVLTVFQGNQDRSAIRTAAFGYLFQIEDTITSDPNLLGQTWFTGPGAGSPGTGAVRFAQFRRGEMRAGPTTKGGWAVELDFEIACEATIERLP